MPLTEATRLITSSSSRCCELVLAQLAGSELVGQIAQVGQLLARQAGGPQVIVRGRQELLRREEALVVRAEQIEDALHDGAGGRPRQLLEEDGSGQRMERPTPWLERERDRWSR